MRLWLWFPVFKFSEWNSVLYTTCFSSTSLFHSNLQPNGLVALQMQSSSRKDNRWDGDPMCRDVLHGWVQHGDELRRWSHRRSCLWASSSTWKYNGRKLTWIRSRSNLSFLEGSSDLCSYILEGSVLTMPWMLLRVSRNLYTWKQLVLFNSGQDKVFWFAWVLYFNQRRHSSSHMISCAYDYLSACF